MTVQTLVLVAYRVLLRRVIVEHARGTPRGEDMRRDLDRGYSIPTRRSGGYFGGGGGGGGGGRDRSVSLSLLTQLYSDIIIILRVLTSPFLLSS